MKTLHLSLSDLEKDCDFLNSCNIESHLLDTLPENDSGWCDFTTGARWLTTNDVIIFPSVTDEEEIILIAQFAERITEP